MSSKCNAQKIQEAIPKRNSYYQYDAKSSAIFGYTIRMKGSDYFSALIMNGEGILFSIQLCM